MQQDNIYHLNQEERNKLITGIEKVCNVVKPSYGAAGGNVIVQDIGYPYHRVTNDGKVMIDTIKLIDPVEDIGANIIKELGNKADKDSGDGRKTTIIIANAIIQESLKSKSNPTEIRNSLNECLPLILESIDKQKRIITPNEVAAVATISAENEKIGNLIQEIYQKIGPESYIEVEPSQTYETTYEIKEGVTLRNAGFISPYMITEPDKNRAVYNNPHILITKQKIGAVSDIDPLFRKLSEGGINEAIIYCDDIDQSVLGALAFTHGKGIFKTLIIKAPTIWKDWFYEDFAKITGATIVDPSTGVTLKTVELKHLGTCDRIISTKEETRVVGFKDVTLHIEYLKGLGTEEGKLRASWLNRQIGVLKVGTSSESELNYVVKKATDGCSAAFLALKDGVVAGGGLCLSIVGSSLDEKTIGEQILRKVLKVPMHQIIENAGGEKEPTVSCSIEDILKIGFNAKTNKWVNMFEAGILDPSLVVKNAVRNAISVAGIVLTAKSVVYLLKQEKNENSLQMPTM